MSKIIRTYCYKRLYGKKRVRRVSVSPRPRVVALCLVPSSYGHVLIYRSPVLGSTTTIVLPRFSLRLATWRADPNSGAAGNSGQIYLLSLASLAAAKSSAWSASLNLDYLIHQLHSKNRRYKPSTYSLDFVGSWLATGKDQVSRPAPQQLPGKKAFWV